MTTVPRAAALVGLLALAACDPRGGRRSGPVAMDAFVPLVPADRRARACEQPVVTDDARHLRMGSGRRLLFLSLDRSGRPLLYQDHGRGEDAGP